MNIALIQTRINSTRLKGKSLMKINGITLTEYLIRACRKAKFVDSVGIIYPCTDKKEFDKFNFDEKCICYSHEGDEANVLERYYFAIKKITKFFNYNIKNIIRITSDCPLLFYYPHIIDDTLSLHINDNNDYTHNRCKSGFPSGLDVEIFRKDALELAYKNAKENEHTEHVTMFFKKNPKIFKIGELKSYSKIDDKFSIDTIDDFKKVKNIINLLELNER